MHNFYIVKCITYCAICILAFIIMLLYNCLRRCVSVASRAKYIYEWQKENVERLNLTLKKGSKETIRAHVNKTGESINGFVVRAIDETMQRDADRINQQGTGPDA